MDLLQAFVDYLLYEKNYSPLTVKAYKKDIEAFNEFVVSNYDEAGLTKIDYNQIRSWIIFLVEEGLSNRSVNRKISSLNTFFKYLLKIEEITSNPLAKHKSLKTSKKIQVPFSQEEVEVVINRIDGADEFESIRNKLIVELFYSTGIRRIELINIQLKDIDVNRKTLLVKGKRNKERLIPLLPTVVETLHKYLELRSDLELIVDKEVLFLTRKGCKTYEVLIYRLINTYFSNASSKEKTSPHILRHSFATHLLNEGADLNAVKELLGHSSLSSTQVYTHNNISELTKVYKNAHPRSRKS